jgi:hypothetical protein
VDGVLLSADAARAATVASSAPGTKASARSGTNQTGAGAPVGGGVALALLGLGALAERKRVPRLTIK